MKTRDERKIYIGIELFFLPLKEGDFILKTPDLFYSYNPPQGEEGKRFLLLWDVDNSEEEIQAQTQLYYYSMCDSLYGNLPPRCHPWTVPILRFVCIVPSNLSDRKLNEKRGCFPFFRWNAASMIFSACSTLGNGIECIAHENFDNHFQGRNMRQEEPQWILTEKGYKKALRRFENRAMTLLTSIASVQTYALFMPQYDHVSAYISEVSHHVPREIWEKAWRRIELAKVGLHFQPWFRESEMRQKLYPGDLMLIRKRKRFYLYDYEGGRRLRYNKEQNCVEETLCVAGALPYYPLKQIHMLPRGNCCPHYLIRDGKRFTINSNIVCPYE